MSYDSVKLIDLFKKISDVIDISDDKREDLLNYFSSFQDLGEISKLQLVEMIHYFEREDLIPLITVGWELFRSGAIDEKCEGLYIMLARKVNDNLKMFDEPEREYNR